MPQVVEPAIETFAKIKVVGVGGAGGPDLPGCSNRCVWFGDVTIYRVTRVGCGRVILRRPSS